MKTFEKMAAQGDMMLIKLDALPVSMDLLEEIDTENSAHVLTHSETGHHHLTIDRPGMKHYRFIEKHAKGMDILRSFLVVPDDGQETDVVHMRSTHTHETLRLPGPGIYEVRRQREWDATEGWRYAAD